MDMDKDGEPLMDPDSQFDGDGSPERTVDPVSDDDEDDWRRERSPTPVFGGSTVDEDKVGKPRKRLLKKGGKEASLGLNGSPTSVGGGLDDWGEEEEEQQQPTSSSKKRKEVALKEGKGSGSGGKEKRRKSSSSSSSKVDRSGGKVSRSGEKGYGGRSRDHGADPEMKELWDTIAGGYSEGGGGDGYGTSGGTTYSGGNDLHLEVHYQLEGRVHSSHQNQLAT